jgi:pimeloyl-ACP methyl ester carboxylesterase
MTARRSALRLAPVINSRHPSFRAAASFYRQHMSARLGVILLHGKLGDPLGHDGLDALAVGLLAAGHAIALPSMPWAHDGWLTIDRDVPASLALIDRTAAQLRGQGAAHIVLVGHSLGADVALAYAVSRRDVAGVVMADPAHTPAARAARDGATRDALERARLLVAEGRGDARFVGPDGDGTARALNTRAAIYLSWMDPAGLAEMSVQAPLLPASIPLMLAIGPRHPFRHAAEHAVFRPAARHPYSRWLAVGDGADALAERAAIEDWIVRLPR